MRLNQPQPEDPTQEELEAERYLKTKEFLEHDKKKFNKLNFDEGKDCPICFEEFTDSCDIIELNCSDQHIFHVDCAKQMLCHSKTV